MIVKSHFNNNLDMIELWNKIYIIIIIKYIILYR
jgi:hypothetical protein